MHHYPGWAQEFARKYLGKTLNHFVLHGNVRDYVLLHDARGGETTPEPVFQRFNTFLAEELFAARELLLCYDRAGGLQFRDAHSKHDFMSRLPAAYQEGGKEPLPKNPATVLSLLEKYFRQRIGEGKSVALIIDYAETIIPNSDAGSAASEERNVLVSLLKWAQDPSFLAADFTVVLLTGNLSDLSRSLVQSPFNASIQVGLPDAPARHVFIRHFMEDSKLPGPLSALSLEQLAAQTAGLSFIQIKNMLGQARENKLKISYEGLQQTKKELIEAEAHDLLEFVETDATLDAVAGHVQVKKHLRQASASLKQGHGDTLPMGYLVCGPVGTGKTFLVSCFAGEVGIPMVKLKNFRSQWQGVTEGNLEKILTLLDAMAPVAVMIDEADAYLGDRVSGGDSGVSSRVFAKIASFMSNTANRGRIIWFLMTARP
ncbi:MAG: AAA family ATPase, partial [Cyclonatronaceae bacterium]